jgi:hypothetical protein
MAEHFVVTSDGGAHVRFRRALEIGNELLVLAAARELPTSRSTTRSASASCSATATPSATSEPPVAGTLAPSSSESTKTLAGLEFPSEHPLDRETAAHHPDAAVSLLAVYPGQVAR